ncbi:MAG: hypothetical protein WA057_06715 [Candidatus Magasanikiibacteriota bacterium]
MDPTHNHEQAEIARVEAERAEYKKTAKQIVTRLFQDVLSNDELIKRAQCADQTEFVTPAQMQVRAKDNPTEPDVDGFIQIDLTDTEVRRHSVITHSKSRAETLHTLLHESVHLMSPRPTLISNPMDEPGDEKFSDYLGAIRYERFRRNKKVDIRSLADKPNAQALFWEAVTDWLAEEGLENELSPEEIDEIADGGYYERHWIYYLVRKSPNKPELIKAIKEAYTQGNEDPLLWILQKQSQTTDNSLYEKMLDIMGRPRTETDRVDDWMKIIDQYFKK